MTTRYPSRQEVAEHQRAELERLQAERASAEYETPALPAIFYRTVVREKGYVMTHPGNSRSSPLLQHHAQLLRQIREHPTGGLAYLYAALGIGIGTGNALLRELKAAGYLFIREDKSTRATGGRPRKVPVLTPQGMEMLQAYEKRAQTP